MEKIKALVMANTVGLTASNFFSKQNEVHEPMVIFTEGNKALQAFRIYARTLEDIEFMNKHKVFFTFDVPENETQWHYGAVFYGVNEKRKEITAATGIIKERLIC
jgi:hypothetical protein